MIPSQIPPYANTQDYYTQDSQKDFSTPEAVSELSRYANLLAQRNLELILLTEENVVDCVLKDLLEGYDWQRDAFGECMEAQGETNLTNTPFEQRDRVIFGLREKSCSVHSCIVYTLDDPQEGSWEIESFAVFQDDQRKKLGSLLLLTTMDILKQHNARKIHLNSSKAGIECYAKMGYFLVPKNPGDSNPCGKSIPEAIKAIEGVPISDKQLTFSWNNEIQEDRLEARAKAINNSFLEGEKAEQSAPAPLASVGGSFFIATK